MLDVKQLVQEELTVNGTKTARMYYLEKTFNKDIRILINPVDGISAKFTANILEISVPTLTKWRQRLGLQTRTIKPGPKR